MRRGLLDPASLQHLLFQALDRSDNFVLVLEHSGDPADGLIVAATNDAFCRGSGFSAEDLIGRPFRDLAAQDADPATCAALEQAARAGRSLRSELLCGRRTGAPFWLGLHLMPTDEGNPPCSVLLGRDITDSLRDRQQHAAIQGLLAKVFVSVRAAVSIVDERGAILMANPALDRLLHTRPGELIGRIGMDLIAPEQREAVLAARQRHVETAQDYALETVVQRLDGSRVAVHLASTIVERDDLKRFRILTLSEREPAEPTATRPRACRRQDQADRSGRGPHRAGCRLGRGGVAGDRPAQSMSSAVAADRATRGRIRWMAASSSALARRRRRRPRFAPRSSPARSASA